MKSPTLYSQFGKYGRIAEIWGGGGGGAPPKKVQGQGHEKESQGHKGTPIWSQWHLSRLCQSSQGQSLRDGLARIDDHQTYCEDRFLYFSRKNKSILRISVRHTHE